MQNKISTDKIDTIVSRGFNTGYRYGEKTKIAKELGINRKTIYRRWKMIENNLQSESHFKKI